MAVSAPTKDVEKFPLRREPEGVQDPAGRLRQDARRDLAGARCGTPNGPVSMDFYNLELSDTNQVDHNCHAYEVPFKVVDEA